jgi:hypothetical protein
MYETVILHIKNIFPFLKRVNPNISYYESRKTMNNDQNYWVVGLFPSSSILATRKDDVSENLFPFSGVGEDTYPVGSLRQS